TNLLLDEFSKHQEDWKIWSDTADTGPRLIIGTHYGVGTAFYELATRKDMHKSIWHWSQHPEKKKGLYHYDAQTNKVTILDGAYDFPEDYRYVMDGSPTGGPFPGLRSPWYDKECQRRANARDVAMHLDIDPKGSVSAFFDRIMILQLMQLTCEPYWEGDVDYDHDAGEPRGLVPRKGGPLRLWCHLSNGLPVPDVYAFGADIATATGATPSCLSGVRSRAGEKVLEYAIAFIQPEKFAVLTVALCKMWKTAEGFTSMLAWEQQGPGLVFGNK